LKTPTEKENLVPVSESSALLLLKSITYLKAFAKECFGMAAIEEEMKLIEQSLELCKQLERNQNFDQQRLLNEVQLWHLKAATLWVKKK